MTWDVVMSEGGSVSDSQKLRRLEQTARARKKVRLRFAVAGTRSLLPMNMSCQDLRFDSKYDAPSLQQRRRSTLFEESHALSLMLS